MDVHEVYSGKTGLDLPCIRVEQLDTQLLAAHSGPDGGLVQVASPRNERLVRIVNLDDELTLSTDDASSLLKPLTKDHVNNGETMDRGNNGETIDHVNNGETMDRVNNDDHDDNMKPSTSGNVLANYDWNSSNVHAYGLSKSLYETHPISNTRVGDPIADVFGILVRDGSALMALADGVNWGVKSQLAARCAVRASLENLNRAVLKQEMADSNAVFHALLGGIQAAQSLILQEQGSLTTLCVAVVCKVLDSNSWLLCACNVGDSLCFVYNANSGVREVTIASHDSGRLRDMRDAGGALGPVSGRNPELNNLTCAMTFVDPGDIVFLTSDGVSDNFDPVVAKLCLVQTENLLTLEHGVRSVSPTPNVDGTNAVPPRSGRNCAASFPSVSQEQRQKLQLQQMTAVIRSGLSNDQQSSALQLYQQPRALQLCHQPDQQPSAFKLCRQPGQQPSALQLCHRLVEFAEQISASKRCVLQDPELYKGERSLSELERKERKRMARERLMELPGKLDHATVVAYTVGGKCTASGEIIVPPLENLTSTLRRADEKVRRLAETARCSSQRRSVCEVSAHAVTARPLSPYEKQPMSFETTNVRRKKHDRCSPGRHTLGVDIAWLKRVVSSNPDSSTNRTTTPRNSQAEPSMSTSTMTFRDRLRGLGSSMLGSSPRKSP